MPEFRIEMPFAKEPTCDERNRNILQMVVGNEFTIVCVLSAVQHNGRWILHSIEIHRENTSEEISVSGNLIIDSSYDSPISRNFSRIIQKGSSFIPLWSYINVRLAARLTLHSLIGFVKISDNSEKQKDSLARGESINTIQKKSLELLSKEFEQLLGPQSSCFTDVNLKCGATCIPAHKNILCARSPVFAAMFAHPTEESFKNEVNITDIDASILQALLIYMYTGKTADLTASSAADLLSAADKYQLLDLKSVCSYFLKETVCPENVWKIFALGDLHDEDLKSFAADYICYKCGDSSVLKNSEEWKALRNERPDSAMDILESMVSFIGKKLQR